MTKEQFINLLNNPSTINLNLIAGLEDITLRFPYFQNAHLLLAKQYHGHENIRYDSYIRKASAYANSRERLFRLINQTPNEIIHIETNINSDVESTNEVVVNNSLHPSNTNHEVIDEVDDSNETLFHNNEIIESDLNNIAINDDKSINDIDNNAEVEQLSVLEQRLKEIEEKNNPITINDKKDNDQEINTVSIEEKESIPGDDDSIVPKANESLSNVEEVINENNSLEVNINSDFINQVDENTVPVIDLSSNTSQDSIEEVNTGANNESSTSEHIVENPSEETTTPHPNETHTFSEWLKLKSVPVIPDENIHQHFSIDDLSYKSNPEKNKLPKQKLIEEFIEKEPRIVPARSEFYSPGNMARKSAQENSDLVSETLAKIYAHQGNYIKAINTYKKLILKKPEKSGYFAALIKELEEKGKEEK